MGTYYSQLARGFLFPSSQPAPASKSWEPDQNCLQMLCRVAKLCSCSGMALGFQLHNEVAASQNCPCMKKSSALRSTMYLRQITIKSNIKVCQFSHLSNTLAPPWRWDDWFSPYEQMLRAMGSVERSCCPGLRPCYGGFNHAVDLYHTPAACWVSLETVWRNTGCYTHLGIQQLGSVSHWVRLFQPEFNCSPISLNLLVCCQSCLLLIQVVVCLHSPCAIRCGWLPPLQGK